ncbi:MAG: MoaD/ThiS family protein [Candidatus Hermodarchaeota archaeon]
MSKIKVSFFSLLIDIVGREEISLSINSEMTIKNILEKLRLSFGKSFEEKIFNSEGILNKYIIIGLNGKDIRKFDGLDTIIKDGDTISILPAIAGG